MNSLSMAALGGLALSLVASATLAQPDDSHMPRADANSTGHVSLAEYKASREAFIMKADTNHDGTVSRAEWDDFSKAVRRDLELSGVAGAELIGQGGWWAALDADGDGLVTHDEIQALTEAKFAQYDADKNGLISRSEAEEVRRTARASLR